MAEHDPIAFASALSAKLATRSRHVCVFLGAGAARACGLPDVSELQAKVVEALEEPNRERFRAQLEDRDLEQALSRLRRIAGLLDDTEQQIDGLTGTQAAELDGAVCRAVVANLALEQAELEPMLHLAAWVARADYHLPVELFTVNYDLLLETALERLKVPYFDGFIGALTGRFQTELVEAVATLPEAMPSFFARLWKLHGSVNWLWEGGERSEIVRLGTAVESGEAAAIYPSDTKYEESRRVPFVVLQDRLRRALHQPETLTLISGYSFSDEHLNEMLFDAAVRRERSELTAFCFSEIPSSVAERARMTPNLQVITGKEAILGGVRGEWKAPDEPVEGIWTDGAFALRDFGHLADYLARSSAREDELEALLRTLLARGEAQAADA
jgi:hypothetical protein